MKERRWRVSVYLFLLLSSSVLIAKSRILPEGKSAAFLRYTAGDIIIKLQGSDGRDGIYRIIDARNPDNVNKLTPDSLANLSVENYPAIKNGDVINVAEKSKRFSAEKMTVIELMLLEIPLSIKEMTAADWESLPGIGYNLAIEINRYSQKNDGIDSLEELAALSGVGEGRLKRIRPFFSVR